MWRLLDLGAVDGYTMTNLYEAVGLSVGRGESSNTIIINHPSSPFVNIGYHQLMEKEINIPYVRQQGFDLVRRTIGGGAILDGPWEQDYFVVINKESPKCPATVQEFYLKFLQAPISALRKLGLDADIRPPNDILVNGRKISGNGMISLENANVLAGDLLLDTPSDLMSEIIKAPSEKFKDKLSQTMSEWLTSIKQEKESIVSREEVKKLLVESFEELLGEKLELGELGEQERNKLDKLVEERRKADWIYGKDDDLRSILPEGSRVTKVGGGVVVSEAVHKAGKMIRVNMVSKDEKIEGISISGDFFTMPYTGAIERLQEGLIGTALNMEEVSSKIDAIFEDTDLVVLGASRKDFTTAILKAKRGLR